MLRFWATSMIASSIGHSTGHKGVTMPDAKITHDDLAAFVGRVVNLPESIADEKRKRRPARFILSGTSRSRCVG